jgi:thioredoxin-related protein
MIYVFSSPICEPCQQLKFIVFELQQDFPNLQWKFINTIDDIEGLTKKYEVEKVPTIVIDSPRGIYRHTGTDIAGYYNLLRGY